MYVTRHIDWLSVTVSERAIVNRLLPQSDLQYVGVGHHGYKSAFEDRSSGARVETDSPIQGMDTHITLGGEALNIVRAWYPAGDDGLLAEARSCGARVSRVDLAINAHEGNLTVRDFYDAYKSGELTSPMRRAYYVEGIGNERAGDTLYLGSPKSDRQLRIYNKNAEQAIVDAESWLRLELVLRDLRAKSAVSACANNAVATVISSHVAASIVWDEQELQRCLGSDVSAVTPIPRRPSNTEKWLLEQCAPALARVVALRGDFMVEFMTSFKQALDKLTSGD